MGGYHVIEVVGSTKNGESSQSMAQKVEKVAKEMGMFDIVVSMKSFGATEDFPHLMTMVQQRGGKVPPFRWGQISLRGTTTGVLILTKRA